MFIKYLPILCLLFCHSAIAAPDLNTPLTLVQLVDIALENHPETHQQWWKAQRVAAALGSQKSAYYPRLDVNTSVINGREFKYIKGPDETYTLLGADLVLSFLLYDFGERHAGVQAAKHALQAAHWEKEWAFQKVMMNVIENGYSSLHAQEAYEIAQASCRDAEAMLNAAKQLNLAGLSPISDVYISEALVSQMKIEVLEHKGLLAIQLGKLASSLGLPADTHIPLAPMDHMPSWEPMQMRDLISFAKEQRADLLAKQADLSESISQQDRTRSSYNPKISLSGRAGANHALHDKANAAQYRLGLNFDVPLYNLDAIYQKRKAHAETQILKEELAQLELDIALEILTYCNMLESAQEMYLHAQNNLRHASNAYEGVMEKYKAGKERF